MFHPRNRSSYVLAVALAITACQPAAQSSVDASGSSDSDDADPASRRHDAAVPADAGSRSDASIGDARLGDAAPGDARPPDAMAADAGTTTGGAGIVSCYTEGAPGNTCTLPIHCCFTNYSSQHDGFCMNTACTYGTIDCDGPD